MLRVLTIICVLAQSILCYGSPGRGNGKHGSSSSIGSSSSTSSSSSSSSSEDSTKGMFSHLFTDEEFEEISQNKRIRREIRDLSNDQWNRVATAMNIMKYVSEEEGKEIYGNDYRNY